MSHGIDVHDVRFYCGLFLKGEAEFLFGSGGNNTSNYMRICVLTFVYGCECARLSLYVGEN